MRIQKKSIADDKIYRFASKIFDDAIFRFPMPLKFEVVEFHLRDSTFGLGAGSTAIICIDHDSPFLRDLDEKGTRALITRQLFKAVLGTEDDIETNKVMARNGYYDDLFYLYYVHTVETKEDCMDAVRPALNNKDDLNFIKSAMRA
ncbi:MAG: hypothetical protein HYW27_03195 [Candidatus Aenigmarchaeota archaeon]|nr:hypothetical protein [Candidatus Aenigmarchaeota archaeon]